jgi:hypothetical protein
MASLIKMTLREYLKRRLKKRLKKRFKQKMDLDWNGTSAIKPIRQGVWGRVISKLAI